MKTVQPLTMETKVVAAEQQVSTTVAGEVVVLDLQGGIYHGLNGTATMIWQMLRQPRTIGFIRDKVLREYQVDPRQCEADVLALVRDLAGKGIVEVLQETTG